MLAFQRKLSLGIFLSFVFISVYLYFETTKSSSTLDNKVEFDFLQPKTSELLCTTTDTEPSFTACVMNTTISPQSEQIWKYKSWARNSEAPVQKYMTISWKYYPSSTFIDGGANIGFYATLAAVRGLYVLAVEPVAFIARCIQKNVVVNNVERNLKILNHALSDERTTVRLSQELKNHMGTMRVSETHKYKDSITPPVKTILMDDLVRLIPTKIVIIKLDIQGYECKALLSSKRLFKEFFIPYVFMEWNKLVNQQNDLNTPCDENMLNNVIQYMLHTGYTPYSYSGEILNLKKLLVKPPVLNMYWKHRDAKSLY